MPMSTQTMNSPTRPRDNDFTGVYLRVLTSDQPPAEKDWWAAAELIDAGYATGAVQRSKSHVDHGEVRALVKFAPTVQGRIYAQQLAEQKKQRSRIARLSKWVIGLFGVIGGLMLDVVSDLLSTLAKGLLGM
jgi:hypothetical protein